MIMTDSTFTVPLSVDFVANEDRAATFASAYCARRYRGVQIILFNHGWCGGLRRFSRGGSGCAGWRRVVFDLEDLLAVDSSGRYILGSCFNCGGSFGDVSGMALDFCTPLGRPYQDDRSHTRLAQLT